MAASSPDVKGDPEERILSIQKRYYALCKQDAASFIKYNFPPSERWRLFVEGSRQNEGEAQLQLFRTRDLWLKTKNIQFSFLATQVKDFIQGDPALLFARVPEPHKPACIKVSKEIAGIVKTLGETATDLTLEQMLSRGKGWLPFENTESNYLSPLIHEFLALLDDFKQDENVQYIESLQGKAIANVKSLN